VNKYGKKGFRHDVLGFTRIPIREMDSGRDSGVIRNMDYTWVPVESMNDIAMIFRPVFPCLSLTLLFHDCNVRIKIGGVVFHKISSES
jgi:hypothetical protein